MNLQEKLDFRKWLRPQYLNTKIAGKKFPCVITWKMVQKRGGGEELQLSWKASMSVSRFCCILIVLIEDNKLVLSISTADFII